MKKRMALLFVLVLFVFSACSAVAQRRENEQTISFPATQEGRDANNAAIYDTEPFTLAVQLPAGWSLGEVVQQQDLLYTPVAVLQDEKQIGTVGFNIYEEQEGVPQEQYYQLVYSQIRLGSLYAWQVDPYEPICQTENGETTLATVRYKDPDQMQQGKSAAEVPDIENQGILSYDREKKVYVGMHFEEEIPQQTLEEIAKSIKIR